MTMRLSDRKNALAMTRSRYADYYRGLFMNWLDAVSFINYLGY